MTRLRITSSMVRTLFVVTLSVSIALFKVRAIRLRLSPYKGLSAHNARGRSPEVGPNESSKQSCGAGKSGRSAEVGPNESSEQSRGAWKQEKAGKSEDQEKQHLLGPKTASERSEAQSTNAGFPRIATWKHGLNDLSPHYFVWHGRDCYEYNGTQTRRSMAQDQLGCGLTDFGGSKTHSYVGWNQNAHWNLKHWSSGIDYSHYPFNVSLRKGQAFRMPDFCSRAIISELSTVYSRGLRSNSLIAGMKNKSISPDCSKFTPEKQTQKEAKVFNPEVLKKSCWNFVADYRKVYCLGYHHCANCQDSSDANCHLNADLVHCCREAYTRRIAEKPANLPPMREPAQPVSKGGKSKFFPSL